LTALMLVGAGLAAAAIGSSPASAAAQRYASPSGSGTACTAAAPCALTQAITGASSGDEVIVEPGDYPLTASLSSPLLITIHGVAGEPRPRLLFSGGGQTGLKMEIGSTLRYVEVDQAVDAQALYAKNATVDQVIAKASGAAATAMMENSTIRD